MPTLTSVRHRSAHSFARSFACSLAAAMCGLIAVACLGGDSSAPLQSTEVPRTPADVQAHPSAAVGTSTPTASTARRMAALPTWPPPPELIPGGVAPEDLILRLSDLPNGYVIGDEPGCGPMLSTEGLSAEVDAILFDRWPGICSREFIHYTESRLSDQPPLVESALMIFGDAGGSDLAFMAGEAIVRLLTSQSGWRALAAPSTLGDATLLLHTSDAYTKGTTSTEADAILWRDGNLVNVVLIAGLEGMGGQTAAIEYATKQHGRQTIPGTASPDDNDDLEVPLDRPNLAVPVYWLGRAFSPGGDLPQLDLASAWGPIKPGGGPGWNVELDYTPGVKIGVWEPKKWAQFVTTDLGKAAGTPRARKRRS